MDFSDALGRLRHGMRMTRAGWNAPGQWVAIQFPDENSKMGRPYCYISPVGGQLVPWVPSQTDLLADDWQEVA